MNQSGIVSRPLQSRLVAIPQSPLCYWLRERFFDLLTNDVVSSPATKLGDIFFQCVRGLSTGDNQRLVRAFWETSNTRWQPFAKGGGYSKWQGFQTWSIDWPRGKVAMMNLAGASIRNLQYQQKRGYTFSQMGRGSLGVRVLHDGELFEAKSPGLFIVLGSQGPVALLLNCRLVSYFVRFLNNSIDINEGIIARIPRPKNEDRSTTNSMNDIESIQNIIIQYKTFLISRNFTERPFDPRPISIDQTEAVSAILHTLEAFSEHIIFKSYKVEGGDLIAVLDETGTPAGWNPMIPGYDAIPTLSDGLPSVPLAELSDHSLHDLSPCELTDLKRRLRSLYEAGFGGSSEDDDVETAASEEDESGEAVAAGAHIPIPSETFVEELSVKLEVHPISIYWLLKEGRETDGWRCPPEEKRLMEDRFTVLILRLLGHRWPRQVEAGQPVPDWADSDGLIPLTPGCGETTLADRVEECLAAEFPGATVVSVKQEFTDVVGQSLDDWLAGPFFARHISQFRKRPIAWQIQSCPQVVAGSGRRRRGTPQARPAFACLLYYHKLDADTLPKLRSQYVGPLRQRLDTELRGILAVAVEARSDRQEKRRAELDDAIHELTAFDAKLEQVAREGFATAGLKKLLESETLDRWCSLDGKRPHPTTTVDLIAQESAYAPDINDGVRVNIAPLQKAGLLAADVLAKKDVDKAFADRAEWRADERRWVREGKLPQPGWWPEDAQHSPTSDAPGAALSGRQGGEVRPQ